MRNLRQRMGRLGVVMTFLALLFAVSPSLEAAACAAEGCGVLCLEPGEAAEAADGKGQPAEDCSDDGCLCAVGHCNQTANLQTTDEAPFAPVAVAGKIPRTIEPLIPAVPQTPERPPRA